VVLLVITVFYNENFSTTFDEEFASISGIDVKKINSLLVLLTAITVVLTMKVVGIMLTSALLILPAVTALQIAKSFKNAIMLSSLTGISSVLVGIYISLAMNLPTGATIVIVNFILFVIAFLLRRTIQMHRD
jgi:zinc transport system permease protein